MVKELKQEETIVNIPLTDVVSKSIPTRTYLKIGLLMFLLLVAGVLSFILGHKLDVVSLN